MGTVHKFKRPPKNRGQFQGYRPGPSAGRGGPPGKPRKALRPWQRTMIAWTLLIALAAGLVGVNRFVSSEPSQPVPARTQ